jgi:hypothetical protein
MYIFPWPAVSILIIIDRIDHVYFTLERIAFSEIAAEISAEIAQAQQLRQQSPYTALSRGEICGYAEKR